MPEKKREQGGALTLLSEKDAKKYAGQYVCVARLGSKKIIAWGADPGVALHFANKGGHRDPVMFYVPRPGEVFIFEHKLKIPG